MPAPCMRFACEEAASANRLTGRASPSNTWLTPAAVLESWEADNPDRELLAKPRIKDRHRATQIRIAVESEHFRFS